MKSPSTRMLRSAAVLLVPATAFCSNMEWLDANGDGLDDAILWAPEGGAQLHLNQGDGTFESSGRRFGSGAGPLLDAVILNDDRVAIVTENQTRIWDVSRRDPTLAAALPGARRAEPRDFDRDGWDDLVLAGALWRQDADRRFVRVVFDDPMAGGEPLATPHGLHSRSGGGDENVSVSGNVGIILAGPAPSWTSGATGMTTRSPGSGSPTTGRPTNPRPVSWSSIVVNWPGPSWRPSASTTRGGISTFG